MPDLETADLKHVDAKRMTVPLGDSGRTELLVKTKKFTDWIGMLTSKRLLIHGDFGMKRTSALSVLCTMLSRTLHGRPRMVTLVWFCGLHALPRNTKSAGGAAMLRSFTAQLLCQQWLDTQPLLRDIPRFDQALVRGGDIGQLIMLFDWLVRQVPEDVTLFFLVDGVSFYERPEFLDAMSDVLASIVELSIDESIDATVKLLVTSPVATKIVRCAFEDDDLILSMQGLAECGEGMHMARLKRAMGEALSDSEDECSDESLDRSDDDESESSEESSSDDDLDSDST
jgi:hypothetical protein